MRYRGLDANGDMNFGQQQANFLRNSPATVAQSIMTRLRLWFGEWFLDTTAGTPYQQAALGTNKQETIEPAIRSRILDGEGVLEILEFNLVVDSENRKVTITGLVDTIYGEVQISGIL